MMQISTLFGSSDAIKGHDRYLPYGMIGRRVSFPVSTRSRARVTAVVKDVCRNIFDNEVEVTLEDGRVFSFREPSAIVAHGKDVVFVYGDVAGRQKGDAAMFKEMRRTQYGGETMDEAFKRTELEKKRFVRFSVGDAPPKRRRRTKRT